MHMQCISKIRSLRVGSREVLSSDHKELTLVSQLLQEFAFIWAIKFGFFFNPDFQQNDKEIWTKFLNRKSRCFSSGFLSSSSFSNASDWKCQTSLKMADIRDIIVTIRTKTP